MKLPVIIQGGMGAGVSNWLLARTVSNLGHLGVISGTALDTIMARRLQQGDVGDHIRRAVNHFPIPEIAHRVYEKYFIPTGKAIHDAFKRVPMHNLTPSKSLMELTVVANFVEVFLAKEDHEGIVGINLLEKIQLPNLASLYGAMLAGVDYVLMGAGIPREIPGVLDRFANHEEATLKINVEDAGRDDDFRILFNPEEIVGKMEKGLHRPKFLPIISSAVLAITLARKATGEVNGFIIEGPTAGGHNTPPRGGMHLDERGEPIYSDRDLVDLDKIKELGLPFWLAGSYGEPEKIQQALDMGAAGVQIGTPFAFCRESGLADDLKQRAIQKILNDDASVKTDPFASPTGFPFKVFQMEETNSETETYHQRERICDLGYLRTPYKDIEGRVSYRCPSEPIKDFDRKQGKTDDTIGRKCLCNGLLANIGMPQVQKSGYIEKPLLTSGQDVSLIKRFLKNGNLSYSAEDVIEALCPQMALVTV